VPFEMDLRGAATLTVSSAIGRRWRCLDEHGRPEDDAEAGRGRTSQH